MSETMNVPKLLEDGYTLVIDTLSCQKIVFKPEEHFELDHNQRHINNHRDSDGVTQTIKSKYTLAIGDKEEHFVEILNYDFSDKLIIDFYVGEYRDRNKRTASEYLCKSCTKEELDELLFVNISRFISHPERIKHMELNKKDGRVRDGHIMRNFITRKVNGNNEHSIVSHGATSMLSQARLDVFQADSESSK